MKKKKLMVSNLDKEILKMLFKVDFMTDKMISILSGEPLTYINGRLKKMAQARFIKRAIICKEALNYITVEGIKLIDLEPRNIHTPKIGTYAHSYGVYESYLWLSIPHSFSNGSTHSFVDFGAITTERDFNTVRPMTLTGHRKDGHPVYKNADSTVHDPDGFFKRSDGSYAAIEFERTKKGARNIVRDNIISNAKRFSVQYWFADDPYVLRGLNSIAEELKNKSIVIKDMRAIRRDLEEYLNKLPAIFSQKSGIPRVSLFGNTMVDPVAVSSLPLRPEYQNTVTFEHRDTVPVSKPMPKPAPATAQAPGSASIPAPAIHKPAPVSDVNELDVEEPKKVMPKKRSTLDDFFSPEHADVSHQKTLGKISFERR